MKLFKSFKEWRKYALSAIRSVCVGMLRILWSVLFGLVSLLAYAYRSTCQFCKREFKAAFFAGLIIVLLSVCWFGTFINERGNRVYAEFQRDSLALKLDSAKQNAYVRMRDSIETDEE